MKKFREELYEICRNIYQTGFNDGKYDIKYFPKNSAEFRMKQILSLIASRIPKKKDAPKTGTEFQNGMYSGYLNCIDDIQRALGVGEK